MFKRLFISLLILSALASEGIVNFPVNFYNLYLADINNSGFYAEYQQSFQKQLNSETEVNRIHPPSLETATDGLFVLSLDTAEYLAQCRPRENDSPNLNGIAQDYYIQALQPVYTQIADTGAIFYNKDILLRSSDNSPPSVL